MPAARPRRLLAIRRRMSFESFERTIPIRAGWKREYYDGKARVRPNWLHVSFELELTAEDNPRVRGPRAVRPADRSQLLDAFLDSFRCAPEYADYPMRLYRKQADKYIDGFFGDVRGRRSEASSVIARNGIILAAALIKERADKPPLLDCLLVRPDHFRKGLATAVTRRAVNRLVAAGHTALHSGAKLANEPSLAWHHRFGFRERPDFFVAEARYHAAAFEYRRRKKYTRLTEAEDRAMTADIERLRVEFERLDEIKQIDFKAAFPDPRDL